MRKLEKPNRCEQDHRARSGGVNPCLLLFVLMVSSRQGGLRCRGRSPFSDSLQSSSWRPSPPQPCGGAPLQEEQPFELPLLHPVWKYEPSVPDRATSGFLATGDGRGAGMSGCTAAGSAGPGPIPSGFPDTGHTAVGVGSGSQATGKAKRNRILSGHRLPLICQRAISFRTLVIP